MLASGTSNGYGSLLNPLFTAMALFSKQNSPHLIDDNSGKSNRHDTHETRLFNVASQSATFTPLSAPLPIQNSCRLGHSIHHPRLLLLPFTSV